MFLDIVIYILLAVHIVVSLLMVFAVLLQRPKNEGLGAAFGGGMADNLLGAQTTNFLQKITVYLGGLFFALTLTLAILYAAQARKRESVAQQDLTIPSTVATPAATPGASPAASPAPSPAVSPADASANAATTPPAAAVEGAPAAASPSPAAATPEATPSSDAAATPAPTPLTDTSSTPAATPAAAESPAPAASPANP